MKIIRRYILSAAVLVMAILIFNIAVLYYIGYQSSRNLKISHLYPGEQMEHIASEFSRSGEIPSENTAIYQLSEKGYTCLKEYRFLWAMLLNKDGEIVWSWNLPEELPKSYDLTDIAEFTRWYLCDYPVRVWETNGNLLVSGYKKDEFTRFHFVYPTKNIEAFPEYLAVFVGMNLILFLLLALWFAYRFYQSLQPVCTGIDALAKRSPILLKEKGMTMELAKRLNQTSRILEDQDQKLRQRDDARTSWISGISHDIRTPLALIMGYSEALAENKKLEKEEQEQAESIRKQSLLIKQLIEDLNLTSKLEYHAQPLHMTEYSPSVLLREAAAEYYNEGLEETYEIEAEATPQTECLRQQGDVSLLKRALRNVIGNSIRHNPKGCRITLRLSVESKCVIWQLLDSGPGIPGNIVAVLEGQTLYEQEDLHIMGLRIVKQIIAAHGGHAAFFKNGRDGYNIEFIIPLEP